MVMIVDAVDHHDFIVIVILLIISSSQALKEFKNVGISTGGVAEVFDNNNGFGELIWLD